jgi:hypothetical protein
MLFGIYSWEIVNTMQVEIALLTRHRRFQWPQGMSTLFSFLHLSHPLSQSSTSYADTPSSSV